MSRLCHLLAFAGVLLLLVWLSQSYSQHEAELVPVRVVRHVRNFDTAPPVAAADASSPPSAAAFSERRTRRRGGVADERLRSSSSIAVVEPGSSTGAASRDDERLAALRCGGLSLPVKACRVWYASRDVLTAPTSPHVLGGRRRACVSACHNRGVCDEQTGVCACEAGYNGSACENLNLRGCNGRTDGLWHASHCAGECDERRGYCFCPGQINGRPMSDTCQVQHMPVDAFAALVLKPDPAWIRFAANGSKLDRGVGKGSGLDRKTELARRDLFDRDLAARTRAFQLEPRRRAQALERFWFGEPSGAGASRWRVVLSEYGVPHAYRGTSGANAVSAASGSAATAAEAASVASAAVLTPPTRRRRQRGRRLRGPSAQELEREAALPAAAALAAGEPTRRHGEHLYQKLAARQTYAMADVLRSAPRPEAHTLPQTPKAAPIRAAWCDATPNDLPRRVAKSCACTYDGLHGPLCDERHEPFCLNQCSGHGVCDATGGGFCHCDAGFFGIDCSMTTREDGRVTLHAEHVAHRRPRSPSVFVYELWDHTSLILQYRGYAGYCVHRTFNERNGTAFNDNYAYTIETALHEWLLRSPHRTVDGASADYFYVPSYLACTILPVYDWVGPGPFATGFPMRPVTAMRMAYDALQQIRQRWPYYNESIRSRRTNHVRPSSLTRPSHAFGISLDSLGFLRLPPDSSRTLLLPGVAFPPRRGRLLGAARAVPALDPAHALGAHGRDADVLLALRARQLGGQVDHRRARTRRAGLVLPTLLEGRLALDDRHAPVLRPPQGPRHPRLRARAQVGGDAMAQGGRRQGMARACRSTRRRSRLAASRGRRRGGDDASAVGACATDAGLLFGQSRA